MAVFDLRPISAALDDLDWIQSRHSGRCIAFANSASEARRFATKRWCELAGSLTSSSPWAREDLVEVQEAERPAGLIMPIGTVMPIYSMKELAKVDLEAATA